MSQESKSTRIAYVALVVSMLSMAGTFGNFVFTVWKHMQAEKTLIKLKAEMHPNSAVELLDNNNLEGFSSDGGHVIGSDKSIIHKVVKEGGVMFPKVLTIFIECKLTNLSKKPITIERVESRIKFGQGSSSVNGSYLQGIYKSENEKVRLPYLLKEQEQVSWGVKIGYPVTTDLEKTILNSVPDLRNVTITDLYGILLEKNINLNKYPNDRPIAISLLFKSADGIDVTSAIDFPFFILGVSKQEDMKARNSK